MRFKKGLGNIATYQGQDNRKSKNIQPGKHVINVSVDFNMYELLALEDIANLRLTVYTYSEE